MRECRDRLNADLRREFGVSLTDMYEGRIPVLDVADFAVNLPRGGSVAEWFGGWGAVTSTDERLMHVAHLLQLQMVQASGKKRNLPEPMPPRSLRGAQLVEQQNRLTRSRVLSMKDSWRG